MSHNEAVVSSSEYILGDVATMRGKADNSREGTTSADTATAAIDVSGAIARGGRMIPNHDIVHDALGFNIPPGHIGRYSNTGHTMNRDEEFMLDGELSPEAVPTTQQLIAVMADGDFNVNVGFADVEAPTQTSLFPAGSVAHFHAGPGYASHFRIIGGATGGTINWAWWPAGR